MHTLYKKSCLLGLLILGMLLWHCTSNPFSDEEAIHSQVLHGTISLSDGMIPNNIFVWLEPFDMCTRTDSSGAYSFSLPAPEAQSGGGLSGIYKLYFYVANYAIRSVDIPMANGLFEPTESTGTSEIGQLPSIELKKLVHIEATQYETHATESHLDSILVHFRMYSLEDEISVRAIFSFPVWKGGPQFMAGLVRGLDPNNSFLRTFLFENPAKGHRESHFKAVPQPIDLNPFLVRIPQYEFPDGLYEFIPFITVEQPNVPSGLLEKLGTDAVTFATTYIDYPIKIRNNLLNTGFIHE